MIPLPSFTPFRSQISTISPRWKLPSNCCMPAASRLRLFFFRANAAPASTISLPRVRRPVNSHRSRLSSLFFAGRNHVAMRVIASPEEHNLVTSSPKEILQQKSASSNQSSAISSQPSVTSDQLPVTSHQPPVTSHQTTPIPSTQPLSPLRLKTEVVKENG